MFLAAILQPIPGHFAHVQRLKTTRLFFGLPCKTWCSWREKGSMIRIHSWCRSLHTQSRGSWESREFPPCFQLWNEGSGISLVTSAQSGWGGAPCAPLFSLETFPSYGRLNPLMCHHFRPDVNRQATLLCADNQGKK